MADRLDAALDGRAIPYGEAGARLGVHPNYCATRRRPAGSSSATWRRADNVVAVRRWRPLAPAEREAVVAEAEALPLPLTRPVSVVWEA